IIGIMPPRFGWWTEDGVWLPMGIDSRDQRGVFPIVRLASGTSSSVADQRLHVLHREFAKANPTGYPRDEFATTLTNYLDITVASGEMRQRDRKSTRLNSSHVSISYAVFCLKKKTK